MSTQPATLFDYSAADLTAEYPGQVHRDDPDTAHQAAADGHRLAGQRREVLLVLAAAGDEGLNGYEAHLLTTCSRPHVATTRLGELEKAGLAEKTDMRRPTDTGSPAVVWVATPDGRRVAAEVARG